MKINNDIQFFNYFLEEINRLSPNKRKTKFDNAYYLKHIINVLTDDSNWAPLQRLFPNNPYHYKTIYNKFLMWSKLGLFEIIFNNFLNSNYKIKDENLFLLIDSTLINNLNGKELIDVNPTYQKKKVTKISLICDSNNITLGLKAFNPTNHDVTTIQNTLDTIKINKNNVKNAYIIGDKGYITRKQFNFLNLKVKTITPPRKNMKRELSKFEKDCLILRRKVEHSFRDLKKYPKIFTRYDSKIKTYMSFIYLASTFNNFCKFAKKIL